MSDNLKFLTYFSEKFRISADDAANFLFIDRRTVYNYKNCTVENLPQKVHEKFIIFFQGYKQFHKENLTLEDIYNTLETIDNDVLADLRVKFLETASIRKSNYVITHTEELFKKSSQKRAVNSLDEFITDFKTLVEYSNLTKGYLYTIFEIIISKVGNENDYNFLEYINKYEGGKKDDSDSE